ncbi:MAG: lipopolysaccharide biosynthesis protein [Methylococcales bacterium]|nr:lipopolysaccharide biosynthesis protein [Methylococcales bacterium]
MNPTPKIESLTSKSITALKWNYLGRLISMSLQFVIGIILARLLGPEPFGLVAIALLIQGLGNLFADGGLGSSLIQSQEISDHDIRSVFSTQILIGIGITTVVSGLAPLLAAFFNEPNSTPVIMVMALSFTIQAIGQTASALIRRNFEFKKIQIISLISYSTSYLGLGIPLAYMEYGVWSLVAAQLAQVSINAFVTYFSYRHPILPLVNPKNCRFLRFGAAITLNNITSWGIGCIDTTIIGHFFETATLGLYNRAFNLVNMPMHAIVSSVQSVLLSAYAKTQDNTALVKRTYVVSIGIMALVFLPVFAAVAAVADSVVLGIYGEKWAAAIPMIKPLAIAISIHAMLAMTGPMLTGIGVPRYELKAQLVTLVFSVPALVFAAQQSINALIYTLLGTYLLRFLLLTIAALVALKEPPTRLVKVLIMPILIAVLLYGCALYVNQYQLGFGYDVRLRLLGNIATCAISYVSLLLLFRKLIVRGVTKAFIVSIQNKLPRFLIKLAGL